jgi:hypothetical protein
MACRLEPDAVAVFDELVEVLQQIYPTFQLVFLVDAVYHFLRHSHLEALFLVRWLCRSRFNRTARELQRAEGVFGNGNEAEPVRDPVVSTLCPVVAAGGARLSRLILTLGDETISSPGVHLSAASTNLASPIPSKGAGCCPPGVV